MMRNEPREFNLFHDKRVGSLYIGETPEQIAESARYCQAFAAGEMHVTVPSEKQMERVDRLIMGGVSDDNDFNKAVAIGRDGKIDKEAIEEFYRGIGFPGSNVKQSVNLAHNAEVLVDAQHDMGFRNFAKRVYGMSEDGTLEKNFGRGPLYIANLGSGIDRLLVHKTGEDASKFYRHNTKFLYLPRGLIGGIVAAGLRYRNDEMTVEQRRAAFFGITPSVPKRSTTSTLKRIFGL